MMDSACAARRCHRVGEGFHFLRAAGDSEGELKVGTLPGLFNCGDIGEDAEASAKTEPTLIAMDAPKLIVPRGAACLVRVADRVVRPAQSSRKLHRCAWASMPARTNRWALPRVRPAAPAVCAPNVSSASAGGVVAELNRRFAAGGATSDLARAGVLVSVFNSSAWSAGVYEEEAWLLPRREQLAHWSASVLNPAHRALWSIVGHTKLGLVLHPRYARLECAFPADGRALLHLSTCGCICCCPCLPRNASPCAARGGLLGEGGGGRCSRAARPGVEPRRKPPPRHQQPAEGGVRCPSTSLQSALQGGRVDHHNEVILDFRAYEQRLPHSVQAIFYARVGGESSPLQQLEDKLAAIRAVHRHFLRAHNATANEIPLVEIDPTLTRRRGCFAWLDAIS